ncbi:MAG: tRNA (guanosine(46)-N7)-methyltransferase TrmB [Saprospirales bacterium]|nr:MAG: tRNA (guanosine(46)-N7)-methyltransferase TrmB [Saprospirales bacterium]
MSKRNKLEKFADLLEFPNVFESFQFKSTKLTRTPTEELEMAGQWNATQFLNSNPIVLELACGRGEYTLELARRYPQNNFLGVDIKGARIWKGASIAKAEGLQNVAFLRSRIEQLELFFNPGEVSQIWIIFPDPFKKDSQINRRLTSPIFLEKYRRILSSDGFVHLKTDSDLLYEYSLETINNQPGVELLHFNEDIYAGDLPHRDLDILTYYEKQHLEDGRTIKYLKFRLR